MRHRSDHKGKGLEASGRCKVLLKWLLNGWVLAFSKAKFRHLSSLQIPSTPQNSLLTFCLSACKGPPSCSTDCSLAIQSSVTAVLEEDLNNAIYATRHVGAEAAEANAW